MTKKDIKDNNIENDFQDKNVENDEVEDTNNFAEEEVIENKLEVINNELKKEKDNFLRLFAEFENYKKRTSKERIELFSSANRELMTVLLPVLDDFERGLQDIEKTADKPLLEGIKLIQNKLKNTLSQKGLKELEVKKGDSFDAEIHEAISQIAAPSKKLKGKIMDTVEKGYKLGETIIRFPKVVLGN